MYGTHSAGAPIAFVPVAVTLFICWYIDSKTRVITKWLFHREIPVVGILLALAAIYFCGVIASSLLGKWFLGNIDKLLSRVPGFRAPFDYVNILYVNIFLAMLGRVQKRPWPAELTSRSTVP